MHRIDDAPGSRIAAGGFVALTFALVLGAAPTQAAPVDFVSGATAFVDAGGAFRSVVDIGQKTFARAAESDATATRLGAAEAQASLPMGRLQVRSDATVNQSRDNVLALATAYVGDSYRHLAGLSPFDWTGATARFDLQVDGLVDVLPTAGAAQNFSLLFLMIYRPGTLDTAGNFCADPTLITTFFWSIGPGPEAAPCGSYQGNLDGRVDRTVSASFAPGSDFDWIFGIRVGGTFNLDVSDQAAPQSGFFRNHFFNTAEFSYVAPEGVTSLVRGSDVAIPAPTTLPLLGLGALLLGLAGRSRIGPST